MSNCPCVKLHLTSTRDCGQTDITIMAGTKEPIVDRHIWRNERNDPRATSRELLWKVDSFKPLIGRLTDDGFNLTPFYLGLVKSGAGHLFRIVCERGLLLLLLYHSNSSKNSNSSNCSKFLIIPTVPIIPIVPRVLPEFQQFWSAL